jgi:hypothetical protein
MNGLIPLSLRLQIAGKYINASGRLDDCSNSARIGLN